MQVNIVPALINSVLLAAGEAGWQEEAANNPWNIIADTVKTVGARDKSGACWSWGNGQNFSWKGSWRNWTV